MSYKEPAFMKELHEIGAKDYYKTRKMSFKEISDLINNEAKITLEEYGLNKKK